ncbi:MAG: hypothetical protein HQL39_02915 [Alphaproteobacteria bacterium]|nr:hypothetical protein [Alphaproteobacteria bacterium]
MHPLFVRLSADLGELRQELREIDAAEALFDAQGGPLAQSWARWKALAAGTEGVYTGIEKILRMIAREIDDYVPDDESWHRSLLQQMALPLEGVRPAVLSPDTFRLLDALRGFRHRVRDIYGFGLDPEFVTTNLARLRLAVPAFEQDFARLAEAVG